MSAAPQECGCSAFGARLGLGALQQLSWGAEQKLAVVQPGSHPWGWGAVCGDARQLCVGVALFCKKSARPLGAELFPAETLCGRGEAGSRTAPSFCGRNYLHGGVQKPAQSLWSLLAGPPGVQAAFSRMNEVPALGSLLLLSWGFSCFVARGLAVVVG